MDLFESNPGSALSSNSPQTVGTNPAVPLAERMRPSSLLEFQGQAEIAGPESPLHQILTSNQQLRSIILWGPPGSGKTTLAHIVARHTASPFITISAVTASIKDVKQIMEQARHTLRHTQRSTILFVDEIHRFNKAQQDAFLPFIEDGSIILIGATTENPSFSLVSALLSRARVYVLQALSHGDLVQILERALEDSDRGLGQFEATIQPGILQQIAELSDGDARRALNLLELAVQISPRDPGTGHPLVDADALRQVLQRQHLVYDKSGEEHYNIISAMHKSMRASDVQAALYWTGRMLESGEEPLYVLRRMIRFASEDIGNADPQALTLAMSAHQCYQVLGSPEGELAIIQLAAYLATAPKSNASYVAQKKVSKEIATTGSLPVPMHIRNAPTRLMKDIGYGKGYKYDHDSAGAFSGQDCLPQHIAERQFYTPAPYGFEREIQKRIDWWEKQKSAKPDRT